VVLGAPGGFGVADLVTFPIHADKARHTVIGVLALLVWPEPGRSVTTRHAVVAQVAPLAFRTVLRKYVARDHGLILLAEAQPLDVRQLSESLITDGGACLGVVGVERAQGSAYGPGGQVDAHQTGAAVIGVVAFLSDVTGPGYNAADPDRRVKATLALGTILFEQVALVLRAPIVSRVIDIGQRSDLREDVSVR